MQFKVELSELAEKQYDNILEASGIMVEAKHHKFTFTY